METLLTAENIKKNYTIRKKTGLFKKIRINALDSFSIVIKKGFSTGIVGESGSGKTTLAKILAGIIRPDKGHIYYKNIDIYNKSNFKNYRKNVQIVLQDPYSSFNPRLKLITTFKDGYKIYYKNKSDFYKKLDSLLENIGMSKDDLFRYPHEYSGGQRQRLSIARALMLDPDIIIADEPVSALDVSVQGQIINFFKLLKQKSGKSIVLVSHDLAIIKYLCDEIYVFYKGLLLEKGTKKDIFDNTLHPYTKMLIKASKEKLFTTTYYENTGYCPFSNRCNYFNDKCKDIIELVNLSNTHCVRCTLFL
jgi:oligopeptide/dipeptide ABC transporter ATP-binding protein